MLFFSIKEFINKDLLFGGYELQAFKKKLYSKGKKKIFWLPSSLHICTVPHCMDMNVQHKRNMTS